MNSNMIQKMKDQAYGPLDSLSTPNSTRACIMLLSFSKTVNHAINYIYELERYYTKTSNNRASYKSMKTENIEGC